MVAGTYEPTAEADLRTDVVLDFRQPKPGSCGLVDTIVDGVHAGYQRELDKLEQRFDRELWRKLINAGILSVRRRSRFGRRWLP